MDSNDTSGNTTQSVTERSVCSQLYPKAPTYYQVLTDLPVELTFICIAIILSILTIVIYVTEVFSTEYKLLKEPGKRRQILTLVFIYPMTSGMAMFAIIVPKSTVLVDLLASCYLSFCLYVFVRALIFYYGDTNNMIEANKSNQVSIQTPPCCCCCFCFPKISITRRSMLVLKLTVMQIAVLQPLVLFLKAVVWANDNSSVNESGWDSPFLYLNIITAFSTLFAMYGLTILIRASEQQTALAKHRIKVKFVLLQLVLVFTNIQSAIFNILIRFELPPCEIFYGARVRASLINHIIIIFEMFILAVMARKVYHTSEHGNITVNVDTDKTEYNKVGDNAIEEHNGSSNKPL